MIQEIRELHRYNRWANRRMLDAVAALDERLLSEDLGGSFPTLVETLAHMLTAEWMWLSRWHRVSPVAAPENWELSTLGDIREHWREVELEMAEFVEGLSDASLDEAVRYRDSSGERLSQPLCHTLRHVVNQSTYHRGEVTTLLRQLGGEPASTDLIRFYREQRPHEAETAAGG